MPKSMHGSSALEPNSYLSLIKKDRKVLKKTKDDYQKHWENGHDDEARQSRTTQYMSLVNNYYDLATDQYEIGWSRSSHFCRFNEGEAFQQALVRHEHYMAHMINIRAGNRVLDVGCGVGGPAREIAAFTGCHVVGLNNNRYQIDRATQYTKKAASPTRSLL